MPDDIQTPTIESVQTKPTPLPESPAPRKRGRPTAKTVKERKTRSEQHDFLFGATLDERAYCVSLIRLLRETYWLALALRHILDQEALSKYQWTVKKLKDMLDEFATLDVLAQNASRLGNRWSDHPVLRAVRKEFGDDEISDYKSDLLIQALIESAIKNERV